MKIKEMSVSLDPQGVDAASEAVRGWLEAAGAESRIIARARVSLETMLNAICEHGEEHTRAELRFSRWFGGCLLRVRYDGGRFDPTRIADNEIEAFTASILSRTGMQPSWAMRAGKNELVFRVPTQSHRAEFVMLGCIAAAVAVGLLGPFIPEAVRTGATDYALSFLSDGFLSLLNTFIGVMIFLTVVTGICGIGSAAALGRIGKRMMSRFLLSTFLLCAFNVFVIQFFFPLGSGGGEGSNQIRAILDMVFGILPSNPIQPFLEGNTLQIVFMATLVGLVLLLLGSQTEGLRHLNYQMRAVVMRCVAAVCMFLPVYIFSSLVVQFWNGGASLFLRFWKPLVLCVFLNLSIAAGYMALTCGKLRVKPSVLLPKLLPDFLIGLSTSSSAVALPTSMEINEKKLGIDPSFSQMAHPIGMIFSVGSYSLIYILCGAVLAESCGLTVDIAWWITMWFVCAMLTLATPPVAGGTVSCLSILLLQLHIPEEGLVIGATYAMILDFLCTGFRIPILHMDLALLADRLGLLDHETLRSK